MDDGWLVESARRRKWRGGADKVGTWVDECVNSSDVFILCVFEVVMYIMIGSDDKKKEKMKKGMDLAQNSGNVFNS